MGEKEGKSSNEQKLFAVDRFKSGSWFHNRF
jgi:hypothetical protein